MSGEAGCQSQSSIDWVNQKILRHRFERHHIVVTHTPPPTVRRDPATTRGVTRSNFLKKSADRAIMKMGEVRSGGGANGPGVPPQ